MVRLLRRPGGPCKHEPVTRAARIAVDAIPIVLLVLIGVLFFPSSGQDDSHITFWPARTLAEHGAILNYNLAPVEQSSTLLFTLLLAGLNRVTGIAIPTLAGVLSIGFGVLMIVEAGRIARELVPERRRAVMWIVAASPAVLYWSFSSMETTLAGWLYLLVISTLHRFAFGGRGRIAAFAALAALLLARPEAPMVAGLALLALLVFFRKRPLLELLGVVVVVTAAQMLWRRHTFGYSFPLPVVAKAGRPGLHLLRMGLTYLFSEFRGAMLVLLVLVLAAAVRFLRRRDAPLGATVLVFALAQLAFVVTAGGDWMPGGRFFVALTPLGALVAVELVGRYRLVTCGLIALQIAGVVRLAFRANTPLWAVGGAMPGYSFFESRHPDHRMFIQSVPSALRAIDRVRQKTGAPAVIYSRCAGTGPYYLAAEAPGTFRFIDLYGLTTPEMVACPLTQAFYHDVWGVRVKWHEYAAMKERFRAECGMPLPDIIYDTYDRRLDPDRERVIEDMGYQIVERTASERVTNISSNWGVFVAIRRDLL